MLSHACVGTNDLDKAKAFYDATFATIGVNPGIVDAPKNRILYLAPTGVFIVGQPLNGEPATVGNGGTIGFAVANPEQGDAWHAAGLAHGGTACEDPPGMRPAMNLYLAYLRDPDGNKLCAMYRPAA